jgi:hypothetical protein
LREAVDTYLKSHAEEDWLDTEFMARCAEEVCGKTPVSLARVHEILSKVPGSMAEDIIEDRGER